MPPKKRSPAQLAAASRGTAATKARRLDNFINRMADVDVVQHFIDADFVDVEAPADLREIVDACALSNHTLPQMSHATATPSQWMYATRSWRIRSSPSKTQCLIEKPNVKRAGPITVVV